MTPGIDPKSEHEAAGLYVSDRFGIQRARSSSPLFWGALKAASVRVVIRMLQKVAWELGFAHETIRGTAGEVLQILALAEEDARDSGKDRDAGKEIDELIQRRMENR